MLRSIWYGVFLLAAAPPLCNAALRFVGAAWHLACLPVPRVSIPKMLCSASIVERSRTQHHFLQLRSNQNDIDARLDVLHRETMQAKRELLDARVAEAATEKQLKQEKEQVSTLRGQLADKGQENR